MKIIKILRIVLESAIYVLAITRIKRKMVHYFNA